LKIEKGSIVEWRVNSDEEDTVEDQPPELRNVYTSRSRRHVIAF